MVEGGLDFRLLFEESPDVLLVLLPDAPRFTMVAATRARFAATHTLPETLGKGLFEIFPDNPDDPSADGTSNLRASLDRVIATRQADTMAVQKYDIRRPDGSFEPRYWSPKNIPVLSKAGEVVYILHRVEDVTALVLAGQRGEELLGRANEMEREVIARSVELAAANQKLRDANARLGELDAAKTAFFGNVSHEFRTPLTLMLGPLEDALRDREEPLTPRQRERLTLIHDNALRLLKLVNTLLDFSRLEAGRYRARFAPLDIAAYTAQLAGMFHSAVEKAGLSLVVDCPPASEPAFVDRDLWEKVVTNLVSNAFKFTLEGGIAVHLREEGGRFVLTVEDTGVGIPESEMPRLFERFHRVPGRRGRTHEGTGIGLALVRELVALHGGVVTADSVEGRGTTFRVEMPKGSAHLPADSVSLEAVGASVGPDVAAHVAEASRWSKGRGAEAGTEVGTAAAAKPRVLVVDDNADLREYVAGLLSPVYDVTTAADGEEALSAIGARRPEIVVSDVMMPKLDGFALVRALRSDPETATLPVILLSARAGEESTVEGLDAGSDDYLVKPFAARELLARVRTHVELARARRRFTEDLERANKALDAFAYSVSHDLRAPLRAIEGFSRALAEDYGEALGEGGNEHLSRVVKGVRRMNTLIDALLGLSRTSRAPLSARRVDLSALASEVAAELARSQPERRVTVSIEGGMVAEGDRDLLAVAVSNLLGNAWKFTASKPEARIEFGRLAGEEPTFFVRDDGAGFDMTYASRLFGPFQRLHGSEFEGTGIGLATVQRVIERHGGRIWADAAVGRGATFTFTLPGNSAVFASR